MDFPIPDESHTSDRSIAERHRVVVFGVAFVSMAPIGLLMGRVIANPALSLVATFVCSYAVVLAVVGVLRSRFLAKAALSDFELRHTSRALPRRSADRVRVLCAEGFAVTDIVVVANEEGVVFSRPMALLTRLSGGDAATVSAGGCQIVTSLTNDRWLVTATMKVVTHPRLFIQPAGSGSLADALAIHDQGLAVLHRKGLTRSAQPTAFEAALQIERFEQETLRDVVNDASQTPRSSTLLDRGTVLTDEGVLNLPILR